MAAISTEGALELFGPSWLFLGRDEIVPANRWLCWAAPRKASGPRAQTRVARVGHGGEQRRVALALTLAWAELALDRAGMRCNLLVLDEVGADERMR